MAVVTILLVISIPYQCYSLTKYGYAGYVQYTEGTAGIVIAVPHGGEVAPLDIPDRRYGTVEGDDHTKELGQVVANSICQNLGKCPHLVISNLKRTKLDPNREIREAAQGDARAEKAWKEYHGFIEEAKYKEGTGVVIDLHGQSHRRNSTELGYLLSTGQLNRGDFDTEKSSVKFLARRLGKSGRDIIAGGESLGAYIEEEGYKAFPSPRQPSPGRQQYFPGYYTVETHGSRDRGTWDSVSVETPREVRIDAGRYSRVKFGQALGRAISRFYISNYCSVHK